MAEPVYLSGGRIQGRSDDTAVANTTLTFNSNGTFTPAAGATVNYVVVGGGGGGAKDAYSSSRGAGGGGAGAYRESGVTSSDTAFTSAAEAYTITIGTGGAGGTGSQSGGTDVNGDNGVASSINSSSLTIITADGGGYGGGHSGGNYVGGANGNASGGGGSNEAAGGAAGTYGYAGGNGGGNVSPYSGGGGGGSSAGGANGSGATGGNGGAGKTPSTTYFTQSIIAGGGAGRGGSGNGTGGSGGGGNASASGTVGGAGTANTGSGGGATRNANGGAGGSGIVILSFPVGTSYSTTGSPTVGSAGTVATDKSTITDVQAGTRYEETDTRKIFRYNDTGYGSPAVGTAGDIVTNSAGTLSQATGSGTIFTSGSELQTGCFDFGSTRVRTGNLQLIPRTNFTVAFWTKADSFSTAGSNSPRYIHGDGNSMIIELGNNANPKIVNFQVATASGTNAKEVAHGMSTGTWYHLAFVYDSSNGDMIIYRDGTPIATDTSNPHSLPIQAHTSWWKFGGGSNEYMDGQINDFAIWNTKLPEDGSNSIETLVGNKTNTVKRATSVLKTNIVAYWDGSDATITVPNAALPSSWKEKGTA